ncbi:MAG: biopolymer transporter ExbD [Candidatus Omnitrophica bacterium]|nr:biopolymer transporter ExbD [Candidatus Omnitrophota bacterium]
MRFKNNLRAGQTSRQIELLPLLNVVFLLIMFLILGAFFMVQPSIKVKIPKVITSDFLTENKFAVTITDDNILFLNGKVATAKDLSQELNKLKDRKITVLIKAGQRTRMGSVVKVWELCRNMGIENINLATTQE